MLHVHALICCVRCLVLQSLAQLRDTAAKWEAQAQASLAQNERLKDLLEESATWSIPAAHASSSAPAGSSAAGGSGGSSSAAAAAVQAAEALAAAAAATGSARSAEDGSSGGLGAGASGLPDGSSLVELCRKFERELLLEKARSAQLDLQVRWGGACVFVCCGECWVEG